MAQILIWDASERAGEEHTFSRRPTGIGPLPRAASEPIPFWSLTVHRIVEYSPRILPGARHWKCRARLSAAPPWGFLSFSSTLECKWVHSTAALLKPWQIARWTRSRCFTYPTLSRFFPELYNQPALSLAGALHCHSPPTMPTMLLLSRLQCCYPVTKC